MPSTEAQLQAVRGYLQAHTTLDVWAEPRKAGRPVDVHVSPAQRRALVTFLEGQELQPQVFIEDLHSAVDAHVSSVRRRGGEDMNWNNYFRLEQIYKWMEALQKSNPGVVSTVDIGKSNEGRVIKGIIIKFAPGLPVAMIESGIHAREWIGPASATFFVDKILNSAESDVVRKYEWHIFPSVNPDGYVYTWDKDRNWRKTRSRNWFFYRGVDANRNWPFHWMEAGANRDPSSEIYGGPWAESEPETRALRKYVDKLAARMHAYIGLHSYSQLLMFPWGFTSQHAKTHDKMNDIATKAIAAVTGVAGTHYDFGNIADTIYPASGNTIDYVYSKCVPYPFVFELRDNGEYGFLLPPDQITEAASEAWAGVRVIVEEALRAGVPAQNPPSC